MQSEIAWWALYGLFLMQVIFNAIQHQRHMRALERHVQWLRDRIALMEEANDAE